MKATGIIRRIDELGRIVIPKEIRKSLRIKDGESLEIYVDDNSNIILQKYSTLKEMVDLSQQLTDAFYRNYKKTILISDSNNIIACSGEKKKFLGKNIGVDIENKMITFESKLFSNSDFKILEDSEYKGSFCYSCILNNGECVGFIMCIDNDIVLDDEYLALKMVVSFLENYLS